MTREQIEVIVRSAGASSETNDAGLRLPEGTKMTFHLAHGGASLSVANVETVRFEADLLHARTSKQTFAFATSDVFAVAIEGAGGQPARRPAGF